MKIAMIEQRLSRLWSVWVAALIPVLCALQDVLPQLRDVLPSHWYAWLAIAVIVARAIKQPTKPEE